MQFKKQQKKKRGIDITSLIDVMFILLIFFMVSSSFVEQPGMKLELPTTKSREVEKVEKLALYVSKEGDLFLNDKPVKLDSLQYVIKAAIPNAKEKTLVLKADKDVHHGLVVEIMDIAKRSGLKKIVIGTRIENK
ncbi:MAG: biopolymer transporter ExbD [Calditrichaeota bacterium]|nr:biopolymer transporter ExbD [Calditrichota bacterium]